MEYCSHAVAAFWLVGYLWSGAGLDSIRLFHNYRQKGMNKRFEIFDLVFQFLYSYLIALLCHIPIPMREN